MLIKIFMASAASNWERNVLRAYGRGIELWADQTNADMPPLSAAEMIGRWQHLDPSRHHVDYDYDENYNPCDLAVFFGSWKAREKGSHVTRNHIVQNAEKFICIETPLISRRTDQTNYYFRTGINGFLSGSAEWPVTSDETSASRLTIMGADWSGWCNNPAGHIVVALQLPGDASLRGADINDWAYQMVLAIRQQTDRRIVIRSHPHASDRAFELHGELAFRLLNHGLDNLCFSDGKIVPWSQDLENAYCTVTYTSGLAVDSILRGIPTLASDVGNFAYALSSNFPKDIECLHMASEQEVHEWLRRLSACQWNTDEMADGTAWAATLPIILPNVQDESM